jgi:hypothetical protein
MSTNGQITFIAGGQAKNSYNHSDSYPGGLGVDVLTWLRTALSEQAEANARQAAEKLTPVNDWPGGDIGAAVPPTTEQRAALAKYTDTGVGGPAEHWYKTLRRTQGDPALILESGYTFDPNLGYSEAYDEHYTYVIDFDKRTFGFQGTTWSFDHLPGNDEFIALASQS